MSPGPRPGPGPWVRTEVVCCRTTTGTVVVPPGGRAALALGAGEEALWCPPAAPLAPTGAEAAAGPDDPGGSALVRLVAAGLLREDR